MKVCVAFTVCKVRCLSVRNSSFSPHTLLSRQVVPWQRGCSLFPMSLVSERTPLPDACPAWPIHVRGRMPGIIAPADGTHKLFCGRGNVLPQGTAIKHGTQVSHLLEAAQKPAEVAIMHCRAHLTNKIGPKYGMTWPTGRLKRL